jgi:hypothetical protein
LTILDADGEVVHTGTSSGAEGLHRYYWNFRGQAPPPPPKTDEEVQDSIAGVERIGELIDSLSAEGSDRAQLERFRDMLTGEGGLAAMFGGGGRGQGDPDAWIERPGENFSQGGGGFSFTPEMRLLMQASRAITGGRGRFGGGGNQAPLAEEGDYSVVLKAGDREFRQTLTVLKGPDAGG